MMEHDDRNPNLNADFDMDAWLDATDALAPGNHNARDVPATKPFVHTVGPSGDALIRQWPADFSTERIDSIAQVLNTAHASMGTAIPQVMPAPGTTDEYSVQIKDQRYSRLTWLEGLPLGRYGGYIDPDGKPINLPLPESADAHQHAAAVASLVASFHAATEGMAKPSALPAITLEDTMNEARAWWFEQRRIIGDRAAEQRDIRRWLRCGNRIVPTASDLIRNEPYLMTEQATVLHNDLWPVNILVSRDQADRGVTGIAGWSHMAIGSPVRDIAMLTTHMQGWKASLTEAIIESYATTHTLRPDQRRIVPAVAALDLVVDVGKLITLSYLDDRMIGHKALPVVRSGMKTMLNSLEVLTHILAPDIDQTERMARKRGPGDGPRTWRKQYDRGPGYRREDRGPARGRNRQNNH